MQECPESLLFFGSFFPSLLWDSSSESLCGPDTRFSAPPALFRKAWTLHPCNPIIMFASTAVNELFLFHGMLLFPLKHVLLVFLFFLKMSSPFALFLFSSRFLSSFLFIFSLCFVLLLLVMAQTFLIILFLVT